MSNFAPKYWGYSSREILLSIRGILGEYFSAVCETNPELHVICPNEFAVSFHLLKAGDRFVKGSERDNELGRKRGSPLLGFSKYSKARPCCGKVQGSTPAQESAVPTIDGNEQLYLLALMLASISHFN